LNFNSLKTLYQGFSTIFALTLDTHRWVE